MSSYEVVGTTGVIIVATRGEAGPGEVSLRVGGATDSYLAWSEHPFPRGTEVVVTGRRGPRTVEVEAIDDLIGDPPPVPSPDDPPTDPLLDL